MTKVDLNCLIKVAQYIIGDESGEYESYMTFCEENELNPKEINGIEQSSHVYALALIGLGFEFPNDPCFICGDDSPELNEQGDCISCLQEIGDN
jgi:hypothetical protein